MGLLDSILGGGRGGGMSKINLALLALLAYRTYKGKGRLADMLANNGVNLPGRTGQSGSSIGANPMGGNAGAPTGGGIGDLLRGGLGGMLAGGAAGGILSGGLNDILKQFQENGKGDVAESWVSRGENKPITPGELERALGSEKINDLVTETGLPRDELLQGLSKALPDVVDKLTPQGRVPSAREADEMV